MEKTERRKLPRWDLHKTEMRAKALYISVFARWTGERLNEQVLSFLVDDCADELGLTTRAHYSALIDTFCQDIDCVLDQHTLVRMSLQLTSNHSTLVSGQPLQRFRGVPTPEWVPFKIGSMAPCSFGSRAGLRLKMRVIAGPYAGYPAERAVPVGFLARLAYDIGFSRRLQYDQPADLVGLQFAGLLVPTTETELKFEDYAVSTAMRKHNRELIKRRSEASD